MAMNGSITLVSTKGSGSTRKVRVATGTTLAEVLTGELGVEVDPDKYTIVVNSKEVTNPRTVKVADGDFVIIVPSAIKGNL